MAIRGLKLRRYAIANANHWSLHGFRLRIDVAETIGDVPGEIFVYRSHPIDPNTGQAPRPDWLSVASFVDLSTYPAGAPDPATDYPFFRLNFIEVDVRSLAIYNQVWLEVQSSVANLINALNLADNLVVAEETWIGDPTGASEQSQPSEGI